MTLKKPAPPPATSRPTLFAIFAVGALAGIPLGMIWSWLDYGAFELGYMSNHVIGGALITGTIVTGTTALWRRLGPRRHR